MKIVQEKIRRRYIVHHGHVLAAGFLLDPALIGWSEVQCRALALWSPGTRFFHIAGGLVVRLPAPVRIDCESSIGLPLTASGVLLLGAPFTSDELKSLNETSESVVTIRAGSIMVERIADAVAVRPESWLNVDAYNIVETTTLGEIPAKPKLTAEPRPADIRSNLSGVPPEAPELGKILKSLRSGTKSEGGATGADFASEAGAWFVRGVRDFFNILGSPSALSNAINPAVRPPGLLKRLAAGLDDLAARLLRNSKLAQLLGRAHAEYLEKMIQMFERGDMNEALRHAIPLGGQAEADLLTLLRPITPRGDLRIVPRQVPASGTINAGHDLLAELRRIYRASFERLEAQGRIEEAAFVLAELLKANEEAVAFLEKHGKLRLAAEIAEARDLAPGLIVRQWFIAGDRDRAVAIARRTSAFGDAVVRLERSNKEDAKVLRLLWAAFLADTGQYASAVDVIWQNESARHLATKWLDQAIELGGPSGARCLARKVTRVPEAFEDTRSRAIALLEDESSENSDSRLMFAQNLTAGERTPEAMALSRISTRSVIRDAGLGYQAISPPTLRKFVDFAGNVALGADIVPIPEIQASRLDRVKSPVELTIGGNDLGTVAVTDAAYLPNGQTIVALGEAGALLINSNGKTVAHFDQPAHQLVVSDHGDRAIAVAPRGESSHLSRLDFLNRCGRPWHDARLLRVASTYDGSMWFVAEGKDLYAIDATSNKFDALWRVPDIGPALSIVRAQGECRVLTVNGDGYEEWRYVIPSLKLTRRIAFHLEDESGFTAFGLCIEPESVPNQAFYTLVGKPIEGEPTTPIAVPPDIMAGDMIFSLSLRQFAEGKVFREIPLFNCAKVPYRMVVSYHWMAFPIPVQNGARLLLIDTKETQLRFNLLLTGAEHVAIKIADGKLVVTDDKGRLIVIDLASGRVLRNLRITI